MKQPIVCATVLTVLTACGSLPAPQGGVVTVRNNQGGNLETFGAQVVAMIHAGTYARVEGDCLSACTMLFALGPDKVCVTPDAVFGMHAPNFFGIPAFEYGQEAVERWSTFLPEELSAKLRSYDLSSLGDVLNIDYYSAEWAVYNGHAHWCE